jgi:hypothetical protein
MSIQTKLELPETVTQFLHDLNGALGEHLVGVVLFGSLARGSGKADSDIDLAVIVTDVDAERSRQEVFRTFGACGASPSSVALSVESYLRLKEFLRVGDPFAWVVCSEGNILKDRCDLLSRLQQQCRSANGDRKVAAIVGYLEDKSRMHYAQATQLFWQCLSNLQLCTMAAAQAAAVQSSKRDVSEKELAGLGDWVRLKEMLQQTSATRREVEAVERLILAHKQARTNAAEHLGKDLVDALRIAGELWARILPGLSKSKGDEK